MVPTGFSLPLGLQTDIKFRSLYLVMWPIDLSKNPSVIKKVTGIWQLLSHERSFFHFGRSGEN